MAITSTEELLSTPYRKQLTPEYLERCSRILPVTRVTTSQLTLEMTARRSIKFYIYFGDQKRMVFYQRGVTETPSLDQIKAWWEQAFDWVDKHSVYASKNAVRALIANGQAEIEREIIFAKESRIETAFINFSEDGWSLNKWSGGVPLLTIAVTRESKQTKVDLRGMLIYRRLLVSPLETSRRIVERLLDELSR